MEITYFVHSTSVDNELGIRSGWSDVPLSVTGEAQALALRSHCAGSSFDAVFSSDLVRAAETARCAFPSCDIIFDRRLREMNYGELNGHPHADFSPDEFECIERRFECGENCRDVETRMRGLLQELYGRSRSRRIAVISHKYPQLALEVICNSMSWRQAVLRDWRRTGRWQPGWIYRVPAS